MGLGDVERTTVPKLSLLAPPRDGGAVMTRTFIPVRCHTSIGVLGAASVAAGLRIEGGVGEGDRRPARPRATGCASSTPPDSSTSNAGHRPTAPTGSPRWPDAPPCVRTARKIFDGTVFPRPRRPHAARHPSGGPR